MDQTTKNIVLIQTYAAMLQCVINLTYCVKFIKFGPASQNIAKYLMP